MDCKLICDYSSGERCIVNVLEFGECLKNNDKDLDLLLNFKDVIIDGIDEDLVFKELDDSIDPLSDDIFCSGWHPPEETDSGSFRWAKPVSYINLSGLKGKTFRFIMATNNPALIDHDIFIFFLDHTTKDRLGNVILTMDSSTKPVSINIDTDNLVLMIMCDSLWVPAVVDIESQDWRELAFAVESAEIV